MKRHIRFIYTALALACAMGTANAQQNLSLGTYSGQQSITATGSVTLTNGFYAPSGSTLRVFTGASYTNCFALSASPSSNQNYVMSRVFKVEGVTSANIDNARSVCEESRTVAYFDGLGSPLQTVSVQASPTGKDIIQPVAYDDFGRERFRYLPYTEAGNNGSYRANALVSGQQAFYSDPAGDVVKTLKPFSETVFEPSPLNRVLQQGAPGVVWQPAVGTDTGHTVRSDYGTNIASEVRLWTAGANGATWGSAYYLPGRLYKTVVKDENWKTADGKAGTTEEFKDFEGRVVLKRNWETPTKSLSTYYVYDDLDNLRYLLPPAVNENGIAVYADISSFSESDESFLHYIYGYHYDGRNRLVEKKIPGKGWEFIVYNKLDQVVITQDANQQANGQWLFTKYDALGRTVYTGLYGSTDTRTVVQATVDGQAMLWETRDNGTAIGYSNSAFPQVIAYYHSISYYDDYAFPGNTLGGASAGQMDGGRIRGLPTGTKITTLGTGTMLLSTVYYDEEGRAVKTKAENHLGGTDIVDNTYNFAGELTASTRTHTANGAVTTIANRYEYDHAGRKLAMMESINGQAEVTLSKLDYNELGQLKKKNLHGTDGSTFMQNTAFAYNERGWIKTSNSAEFSMELKYSNSTVPQYNGNISGQYFTNGTANSFAYSYDGLNRLTSSTASGLGEVIDYDAMGNIRHLTREGFGTNSYTGYEGNRLTVISGFTNGNYTYDLNGNLKIDSQKGINMDYNYLNLPIQITGNQNIVYTYNASGEKLRKVSSLGTVDYIDGIQYKSSGGIDFIQTEEGIVRNNNGNYVYEYNLTDNLGNVRATFYKNPNTQLLEILQRDNYYAFGLRKSSIYGNNKYLYNGKELQDELGEYDYGARFYDPVIGRWYVVDPLVEEDQESSSPYSYVLNNPILLTDPDGRLPEGPVDDFIEGVKEGFVGYFKGIGNAVAHPIETVKNMGFRGVAEAYVGSTGVGLMYNQVKRQIEAGQASVEAYNGNAKPLGRIVGSTSAEIATVVATEAVGKVAGSIRGAVKNVLSGTEKVKVEVPYERPNNATTKQQRASVQGKDCVSCGKSGGKRVADHKTPLVKEYYKTGKINKAKMKALESVQPQCETCSSKQGAEMSRYSKQQKKAHGF